MIFGRTRDRNADAPEFTPIYEAAAALHVPLYLHPQIPAGPVRDSYYSGLGDGLDLNFAIGGIGWQYGTGLQLLRLILSGTFDRFPRFLDHRRPLGEVALF